MSRRRLERGCHDHLHEQRQAVGSAAEDILEALEKGLGETE